MSKTEMSSRERVTAALNHQAPDRVPLVLNACSSTSITIGAYKRLLAHFGFKDDAIAYFSVLHTLPLVDERIMQAFGIDTRPVAAKLPLKSFRWQEENGTHIVHDDWGIGWHKQEGSLYYVDRGHPLQEATINDLDRYPWPDPNNPERFEGVEDQARNLYENSPYAIYGQVIGNNIFQRACFLRGYEQFLLDLVADKQFAHALLRKITDVQKGVTANFLHKCGDTLDIVRAGDDIAAQARLIMSPACYREMIKPYQKEYFASIKAMTSAKLIYHSCGAIYDVIPDLIEIGVDVLNPIQVSCEPMADTRKLKEEFGQKLSFCGGVDTHDILPRGTAADVDAEVHNRIRDLAPGGGYLLAAVHNIQDDVPPENICKLFEAGKRYGRYPLK